MQTYNITTNYSSFHSHDIFSKTDTGTNSYTREELKQFSQQLVSIQPLGSTPSLKKKTQSNDSNICSLYSEFSGLTQIQGLDGVWLKG